MPTPIKPKDRRQRRNRTGIDLVLVTGSGPKEIPSPPPRLLKNTERAWEKYWRSPLAGAVNRDTDMLAVTRLFTLYDERERAYRAYTRQRMIMGSQNQAVLHPMCRVMLRMDGKLRHMEDRIGMTPKSRLQLGITLAGGKKSMDDPRK